MIPPGLVHYTTGELEERAAMCFRRRPDIEFAPPINIEALIENMADVRLKLRRRLKADFKTEGCVCMQPFTKMRTVVIDFGIYAGPWPAYNAALGEEYAHIVLHPSLFLFVKTPEDFVSLQQDPQWRLFEGDARRFSLAIRLPERLVVMEAGRAYSRIVDEFGFGDGDLIEQLIVNKISEGFRVPPKDAYRRITTYPCDLRDRVRNSVQARRGSLIPGSWVVSARAQRSQLRLIDGF